MPKRAYTPALGFSFLTPAYDLAVALVARENAWRGSLIRLLDPVPGDRILDVGCGTGTLAIRLCQREPGVTVTGLDPDPDVLKRARAKAENAGMPITWIEGFLDKSATAMIGSVPKVVSSLVLHQTPLAEKKNILVAMHDVLEPGGRLVIADYGLQRTSLMRLLFRCTVQVFDGVKDTQPNADGLLPELMTDAGFSDVAESDVIKTVTGSISIYTASR